MTISPYCDTSPIPLPLYAMSEDVKQMLSDLQDRFPPDQIEWRIGRSGKKQDGKMWATALVYINNRAIMNRLDHVAGAQNWRNEFKEWKVGEGEKADYGVLCGLSLRIDGEWITKWDGAENTNIEAVKGGLSDSMKRAGVQWGIGRYLYNLDETFVECTTERTKGWNRAYDSKEKQEFYWKTPNMPAWADPEVNKGAVDNFIVRLNKCEKLMDYMPISKEISALRDTLNDHDYRRLMDVMRVVNQKLGGASTIVPTRP